MKAELKNYRQSPRKVRVVANLVRGKKVQQALTELAFLPKRSALPLKRLIESAVANATHNNKVSVDGLIVEKMSVTKGVTLKRFHPVSRGRAHRINKRSTHVEVILAQK